MIRYTFTFKIFLSFLFCFFYLIEAQTTIKGRIIDAQTSRPLSGVDIFINNHNAPAIRTVTDLFVIKSDSTIHKIRFEKSNYQFYSLDLANDTIQNLTVKLKPELLNTINEVVVQGKAKKYKNKKENPAYAIMQELWKRKRNNALTNYKNYQYDEYEKIELALNNIDSAFMKKKIFNKMEFIFKYSDSTANGKLALPIFFNEAIYKNYGINQPVKKTRRQMVANKTAGFQNNEIMTLTVKNLYRDIDIYDNTLNFFNIGFPSPASTDGFSTYDYNLVDTLSIKGQQSYHIKYFPRRTDALAFRGDLYISTDTYAIVRATLRAPKGLNVNFVNGLYTELEFDNPDEKTFLPSKIFTEIDLSLVSKKKDSKGMTAKKTVLFTDYIFDKNIDLKIFDKKPEVELEENFIKDDEYWKTARKDTLSQSEKGVYTMLDELQKVPKFNNILKTFEVISSGYFNIGNGIDLGNIYSIYGNNDVEGTRIRLGARTYFSQNDMWRLEGYGAYGFKDNKVKYGFSARVLLDKNSRLIIGSGTRRDILQLGSKLMTDDGIMARSFASSDVLSSGTNKSLSNVNQTNIFASIEPWKNFTIRLDGTVQNIKSANPSEFNLDYHKNGVLKNNLNDSRLTLTLVAKPGAKFSQIGVDRREHTTLAPTLVLKYTHGFEGLFNADFNYNKLQFLYQQPILVGSLGKSIINLEAGKIFEPVPLAIQSIIPGNQSYSLSRNSFAMMDYYEFVADSYATLQLEHHFNGKILSYIPLIKKLKLREVGFIRTAYGTLSDASKAINFDAKKYSAPDQQMYVEYGFGFENIGFGNLRIFRVDFNWRGNYLNREDVRKFGIKAGIQVNF